MSSGTQPDSPATGGRFEGDAPLLTAGCVMEPRTPGSERDGTPGERTDDLRAELVATLATHRTGTFEDLAQALLEAGWRRVSVDDDTEGPAAAAVREFHVAFGLPINDTTRTLNKLRADLIREEAEETAEAVESGDLEHMAKELADLAYVVYGAALTLGIDLDRAIAEVHWSNMSKLVDGKPVMRPDGKVLKGPNYRPPDMRAAVQALRDGSGTCE